MPNSSRHEVDTLTVAALVGPDHTLSSYLLDGPAEPARVAKILVQVLQYLDGVHSRGAQHCPLTPSTIMLTREGRTQIQGKVPADARQTVVFATPKYSAPDAFQESGNAGTCEVLDSYLLGFMFYELLLGRKLFRAEFGDLENGTAWAWLSWHADKKRCARPLSELLPGVPASISRLIAGMMEKDPARRIKDLRQVLATIQKATEVTLLVTDRKAKQSEVNGHKHARSEHSLWPGPRLNKTVLGLDGDNHRIFGDDISKPRTPERPKMMHRAVGFTIRATSCTWNFLAGHLFEIILSVALLLLAGFLFADRWM